MNKEGMAGFFRPLPRTRLVLRRFDTTKKPLAPPFEKPSGFLLF